MSFLGTANVKDFGAIGDGITDDTAAIQKAINDIGNRGSIYFPKGSYLHTAGFAPPASEVLGRPMPLEIYGDGIATQFINQAPANNPTFAFRNCSYFHLHDLLLCGGSANPNDGVLVDMSPGGQPTINWRIERVICCMAGKGFVLRNTNSGLLRDCRVWPSSLDPAFGVFPPITLTDISHGIYGTGDYCNDIIIDNFNFSVSNRHAPTACSIRFDAGYANTLNIIGGNLEGVLSTANQYALNIENAYPLIVQGVFAENSKFRFSKSYFSFISGVDKAGAGGTLLTNNCRNCTVSNCIDDSLQIDAGTTETMVENCNFDAPANQIIDNGTDTTFRNVMVLGTRVADKGRVPLSSSAYLDTPYGIPVSTQTVAIPNRTRFDQFAIYNTVTGAFTIPFACKVRISMFGYLDNCSLGAQARTTIFKNGATTGLQKFSYCAKTNDVLPLDANFIIDCLAGDTLQIALLNSDSAARNLNECNICLEAI